MSVSSGSSATTNPFRQPKAVWAVAFACVISFMGIGLVDPILPSLSGQLRATHAEVELLFTSYLVVTAVAMLVTGWVSSRIGPKRTLVAGLVLIVVFAALAGMSSGIWGIVGFRAGWGLGNALFIATSLAVIVGSATGGFAGAIVLYETALGLGIATGPLVGGLLGTVSWRGPFFGVSVLMLVALVAILVLLEKTPVPTQRARLSEPITALRHKALRTTSFVGLFYNWGFFTLLGYAPFLMGGLSPIALGAVFFGWGLLVAAFAVFGAPWLKGHFGTPRTLYGALVGIAVLLVAIGVFDSSPVVVIVAVILSGIVVGLNNTLVTTAVMSIAPVPRPTASATYGFVRFIGGGLAPFAAGLMAAAWGATVPFVIAAVVVLIGVGLLATIHRPLTEADVESEQPVSHERADAEEAVREVPGLPGEAVIAQDALAHDTRR
ncbi:MFS transporter [Pseudonocardia endophytica]|uniref:Putative MFS family arabinose efflux permease n=1 Tax=Pseudonocardia endophytica TaxID=401976 RepID=A0A4R1HQ02_PSEEN|nr:MFS transporter [Pseudonocardia endophytica]TCK22530.1 putative MFS family arabinose efflux permease [Pseudonocardia endophytica]